MIRYLAVILMSLLKSISYLLMIELMEEGVVVTVSHQLNHQSGSTSFHRSPSPSPSLLFSRTDWRVTRCHVTLPEYPDLMLTKRANNRVHNSVVVEQNQVSLLPVMGVHIGWADCPPL